MLTLTENAATAVTHLAQRMSTDTGGLRIAQAAAPHEGYAVSLADGPQQGDTVVQDGGARVFVDAVSTVELGDRVLDAHVDDEGGVGFALAQRS
ncbi:Fe-S cluster assembly protein HesB [Microbacterium flavum]|uniref:Fe-S cluster assembly protein HesB n=1 Tax=Microbacterium flavum TaxID=415216 RepID=A0ABS5XVU0_9MICO|nr:Fe-S cluster assembly protein HesB [Microbacterium flavum]MBT8798653.1 Fe-S cluster assembly protein HesB [Microbacterium flavum]